VGWLFPNIHRTGLPGNKSRKMENFKNFQHHCFDDLVQTIRSGTYPKPGAEFQKWLMSAKEMVSAEYHLFLKRVKERVAGETSKRDICMYIDQQYAESVEILETISGIRCQRAGQEPGLQEVLESTSRVLLDVCEFLETRFGDLISQNRKVPRVILVPALNGLRHRIEVLEQRLPRCDISELILKRAWDFVDLRELDFTLDKRALDYKGSLIRTLEGWDWQDRQSLFAPMERLIVYMNFNSKNAIDAILGRIDKIVRGHQDTVDRKFALMDFQREFRQLHRKPGVILNPGYHTVDDFMGNWFQAEISYFDQIGQRSTPMAPSGTGQGHAPLPARTSGYAKLRSNLTVDQLALVLRSVDEAGLVEARSLNQVFREIVPYLSTHFRTEISPGSMRVKSYHPEERD